MQQLQVQANIPHHRSLGDDSTVINVALRLLQLAADSCCCTSALFWRRNHAYSEIDEQSLQRPLPWQGMHAALLHVNAFLFIV